MAEKLKAQNNVPVVSAEAHSLVFLGGINYDKARNERVGRAIIDMSDYTSIITIDDESLDAKSDDTAVFEYANGQKQELPSALAMKQLNDPAVLRYTKLHQRRAKELITAIELAGNGPVDAVFQSVDTSTGILAMHERPDLFRKVVLVDPSSIVKHPRKGLFFKEGLMDGSLHSIFKRPKKISSDDQFESSLSTLDSYRRMKKTARFGNMNATYLSAQAKQLHEIAQSSVAPLITVVASSLDHAYPPGKILESLVDLNDIASMFITDAKHGIGGKKQKLTQIVQVLQSNIAPNSPVQSKIRFAEEVSQKYRTKIMKMMSKTNNQH